MLSLNAGVWTILFGLKKKSGRLQSIVGYTSVQIQLVMQTTPQLKTRTHFKLAFVVCFNV